MAVLAIDTATTALVVAVGHDGQTICSAASAVPRAHSRLLQPMVAELLKHAGVHPAHLSAVLVGLGPGSYTGVRLGVTTAKAIATALDLPVSATSTLAVMAEAAAPVTATMSVTVLALLAARRQRAFGAVYRRTQGRLTQIISPCVIAYDEWLDWMRARAEEGIGPLVVVIDLATQADAKHWLEQASAYCNAQVRLEAIAAGMGPALIRLGHRQDVGCTPRYGEDVHALVPDYALRVEAEVKQGERSAADGSCPHL